MLAGWGGLVSVGQQAFVGLGAYALFAAVVVIGMDPIVAILLAGVFAAVIAAVLGPLLFSAGGTTVRHRQLGGGGSAAADCGAIQVARWRHRPSSISLAELSQMAGVKAVQALIGLRPAAARDVLIYWLALLLAVVITLSIYAFVRSRLGLALAAVVTMRPRLRVGACTGRIRYLLWIAVGIRHRSCRRGGVSAEGTNFTGCRLQRHWTGRRSVIFIVVIGVGSAPSRVR